MMAGERAEPFLLLPPIDEIGSRWGARLASELPELQVEFAANEGEAAAVLAAGCRAAYGTMTPDLLASATRLRWLQAPAAAPPAGYYFAELVRHPVMVTNLRGTYTDNVATHAVALLYALARGLHSYIHLQHASAWSPDRDDASVLALPEATIAIVGMGAIGVRIAELLHPLGCTIVGVDARRRTPPATISALYTSTQLDEVIGDADAVVLTVPHTAETHRLFDHGRLARMKSGALLVNVGRGAVVDVDALMGALASGRLRGVGLDVFPEEPLPAVHPLWREPRAILTPHVASVGPGNDERRFAVLRDNAMRFLTGRPLQNVVDKTVGY